MSGTNSPCGACKFLRRKCVRGCVFAPHFCYEQGASHFAAVHKVFGASNASKILAHLPSGDRSEAAVTISYEAQARLQDPVYGCVSHIFALQQQVANLQAQLTLFKEQGINGSNNNNNNIPSNPNGDRKLYHIKNQFYPDRDVQSLLQDNRQTKLHEFDVNNFNFENCIGPNMPYCGSGSMDIYDTNPSAKCDKSCFPEDNASFDSMESLEIQYLNEHESRKWQFQDDRDDLQSVAFGFNYNNHRLS